MKNKPAFVYSEKYTVNLGEHVFPVQKYRMVYQRLASEGLVSPDNLFVPTFPQKRDLLLVHTPEYLRDLESLAFSPRTAFSEIPLTKEIVEAYKLSAGGTILASQKALEKGMAIHLGGGYHHAFPSRGEGFCYINDVAVSIRRLKRDKHVDRALIVDCDLHQGNGTAFIFREDHSVFTFSIHQENLYPVKEKSDLDIGLPDFTGDGEYSARLSSGIRQIWRDFEPDIVYYLAGADPYRDDQLGQLKLTKAGLKKRDSWIITKCLEKKIPLVILLAGGYAFRVEDTVDIHCHTCRIATTLFGRHLP